MRLHNTYTKAVEELAPIEPGRIRVYNCGPTVYDSPHVGNFRTFAFGDMLRRYLEYRGFQVAQIMNLTDVGHLTQDHVEAGVDKMEEGLRRLREQGVNVSNPYEVADYFIKEFHEARRALNFRDAHRFPRATDHVPDMIRLIQALLEKGAAYRVGGNVYYDVTKFPAYGRLSGNTLEQIKAGARIEINPEKRHPADFALWKTDPRHLMQFDSPWGRGFPGWHIECSAMSMKYLGEQLDIHTGGEDNIFPHHECEIAQSEAATGKAPFVKHWMHARHLLWDGKKMSKSEGTFFTIEDLLRKGYSGHAIRYALVSTHYRQQVNYTLKSFDDAKAAVARLDELNRRLQGVYGAGVSGSETLQSLCEAAEKKFVAFMDDDLNVSGALGVVHEFARDVNKALDDGSVSSASAGAALKTLVDLCDSVFGFLPPVAGSGPPPDILELGRSRQEARARRDWKESDRLRDEIRAKGWIVEDTKEGPKWKRG
ncbi:MAG: cysteine--tRNA ligase [Planctomycetes bacterium]|nr:cysteine--tRNA ligase [Planctomycetota bacterium]